MDCGHFFPFSFQYSVCWVHRRGPIHSQWILIALTAVGPPKYPIFLEEKAQVHARRDYELHKERDCIYLFHSSVRSTSYDAYYTVGARWMARVNEWISYAVKVPQLRLTTPTPTPNVFSGTAPCNFLREGFELLASFSSAELAEWSC